MFVSKGAIFAIIGAGAVFSSAAEIQPRQKPLRRQTTPAPTVSENAPKVTAITGCHLHGSDLFCLAGDEEYLVQTTPPTATSELPAQFTGCHNHGSEMFCIGPGGDEVEVDSASHGHDEHGDHDHDHGHDHDHDHEHGSESESKGGRNCHYHGNVEHCLGDDEDEGELKCDVPNREYNIGLRVGLLFAILATSALGVFGPIFLKQILPPKFAPVFLILKQFGTGIIISTAFVHLYTHATLMFENKCVGELTYESTTSAIVMAGLFLSFCVEFIGQRLVLSKARKASQVTAEQRAKALLSIDVVSVLVMESGILFHSLIIGLTLVLAADSFFITLFVVILFHQVFEGIALGTRIAEIGSRSPLVTQVGPQNGSDTEQDASKIPGTTASSDAASETSSIGYPMKKKLGLAALFAFITPIGMAIGIGVLQQFNGNDKATLIAIGTLDALSAGILVWVGVVEMWAADWMMGTHGRKAELAEADMRTVMLAGTGLVLGLALMSLLGKWA